MSGQVRLDTRDLVRGMRQLSKGLDSGAKDGTMRAAQRCAQNIRQRVPVRTGRLRGTVSAVSTGNGWGVMYGGGLRYARPVAARTGAVAAGIAGQPTQFGRDMRTLAEKEVNRL